MQHSLMGMPVLDPACQAYTVAPIYDEYSRQMALADSTRRMCRGSSMVYRPANTMRVVKPSSANNSPQALMARQRTLLNDGNMGRRRQYALDQALSQHVQGTTSPYEPYAEPVTRASRPVSWPHLQPPQVPVQQQYTQFDVSQYVVPIPAPFLDAEYYSGYQPFPPTPAAYSGHTSPISSFSPLLLPFAASPQAQVPPTYVSSENWSAPAHYTPPMYTTKGSPDTAEPFPPFAPQSSSVSWDAFAERELSTCTAPPSPGDFQPITQMEPNVPSEESISFKPVDEPEEEGDILVGMGLYDTPDKTDTAPELVNYKMSTSHILGTTYRKGAGLKLEEAWEPPAKDDEDEDPEEDASGEEQ